MSPVLQINTDVNTELLCLWPAYLPRAHLRVFSRVSRVSAKPNASVSLHVAVPTPRGGTGGRERLRGAGANRVM